MLPAVYDPAEAMQEGAPVIHDEPDAIGIHDAEHNLVHDIHVAHGDVEQAFAQADHVFEHEYRRTRCSRLISSPTSASPGGTMTTGWYCVPAPRPPSTLGACSPRLSACRSVASGSSSHASAAVSAASRR